MQNNHIKYLLKTNRMKKISVPAIYRKALRSISILSLAFLNYHHALSQKNNKVIYLDNNWYIQSDAKVNEKGDVLSSSNVPLTNWVKTNIPNTVMGALADAGVYKDVYFSKNLEKIPTEQFKTGWWYRTEFEVSTSTSFENAKLTFDGINNYANIWLNGKQIGSADTLKGAFSVFSFDVTKSLVKGKNILAVQVLPPKSGDFTIGFVDWTPRPIDENMGIYRPVHIKLTGSVSVNDVFVYSKVNTETLKEASLSIELMVKNNTNKAVQSTLQAAIGDIQFKQVVNLQPNENKKVVFTPQTNKELTITNPKLWWPHTMGEPALHTLTLKSIVNGSETDNESVIFGIREVSDYMTSTGYRGYKVNGKVIQIRGGGWMDELFLREDARNLEAQVLYTKQMNLNTIRLEGFWGSSHKLYDLCDKYGILLMTGISCHWEWKEYCGKEHDEFGSVKSPEDMALVSKMVDDQVKMFRNHPSIFVWVLGSDAIPRPELEKMYIANFKITDPTRPTLGACKALNSVLTGKTGTKMVGPYDYVSPNYWYTDTLGGAYGFNTETGPGPQIPVLESLEKMLPADKIWPINDEWNFHCARNEFKKLDRFLTAFYSRYGESANIMEFQKKVQVSNYEAIRPMFEAFAVNKSNATGVVQWMLNAAWPKLVWQLYDFYLVPTGAFYGTQTACKPLNIIYNYGDGNIYVSNDKYQTLTGLNAEIKVLDFNSKEVLNKKVSFEVGENLSKKIFDIPELKDITPVYFLDLKITGNDGKILSTNFYWLSTKKEIMDYENSTWFYTPNKQYADFTSLVNLPKSKVTFESKVEKKNNSYKISVKIKNTSNVVAFFIDVKAKGKVSGKLMVPVLWNDNYISLLPGEERELEATILNADVLNDEPVVNIEGWNIE